MIARIAGVEIPANKVIEIGLTYIYGIGRSSSIKILKEAKVDNSKRAKDLTEGEIANLKSIIEKHEVEGDLRRTKMLNIKRLKEIGCYRGDRHKKGLPVRGQRTKTNSRTVRGNVRKTAGSGRKASAEKT
jgi:small subunit ribosomal protein S13